MPTPLLLPYPPLIVLECGSQITLSDFSVLDTGWIERGASICITARAGHRNRGGYFFHVRLNLNINRLGVCLIIIENHIVGYIRRLLVW